MFTINNAAIGGKTTTLNDIPKGTIFEGTVNVPTNVTKEDRWYTGIWVRLHPEAGRHTAYAACLTYREDSGSFIVAVKCSAVIGYRPISKASITIEEYAQ